MSPDVAGHGLHWARHAGHLQLLHLLRLPSTEAGHAVKSCLVTTHPVLAPSQDLPATGHTVDQLSDNIAAAQSLRHDNILHTLAFAVLHSSGGAYDEPSIQRQSIEYPNTPTAADTPALHLPAHHPPSPFSSHSRAAEPLPTLHHRSPSSDQTAGSTAQQPPAELSRSSWPAPGPPPVRIIPPALQDWDDDEAGYETSPSCTYSLSCGYGATPRTHLARSSFDGAGSHDGTSSVLGNSIMGSVVGSGFAGYRLGSMTSLERSRRHSFGSLVEEEEEGDGFSELGAAPLAAASVSMVVVVEFADGGNLQVCPCWDWLRGWRAMYAPKWCVHACACAAHDVHSLGDRSLPEYCWVESCVARVPGLLT